MEAAIRHNNSNLKLAPPSYQPIYMSHVGLMPLRIKLGAAHIYACVVIGTEAQLKLPATNLVPKSTWA